MVPWETAVLLADRALYAVKRNGRNGWIGLHEGSEFQRSVLDASAGQPDVADMIARKVLGVLSSIANISPDSWN